jgi:hypothetical protein|nr:MAG TPA: hypothetical protein [Caudoviricetes sp.]
MKYITQDHIEIKPIECAGYDYYQIGIDEWNIVVGLGGLVNVKNQADKIIENYINKLEKD